MNKTLIEVLRYARSDMPELRIKETEQLTIAFEFEEETGTVFCEDEDGKTILFNKNQLELFPNQRY